VVDGFDDGGRAGVWLGQTLLLYPGLARGMKKPLVMLYRERVTSRRLTIAISLRVQDPQLAVSRVDGFIPGELESTYGVHELTRSRSRSGLRRVALASAGWYG